MYKIAVIGTGYVGLTTGIGLANFGSSVVCLDINEDKIYKLEQGIMPIYEPGMDALLKENMKADRLRFSTDVASGIQWADIVFIAVGTPQSENGTTDLQYLFRAASLIGKHIDGYKIIVTKSTVPVGTNEKIRDIIQENDPYSHEFDVVSNPEFLREGKAMYDFLHPDRVVIGTDNERPIEAMRRIYRPLYLNEVPFVFTDYRTAELIKYASNTFLAMKVAFINEMARLCDTVNANIQTVAYAMGKDGRIGNKFLHAGPGFGGSCFPKDTLSLDAYAKEIGVELSLVEAIIQSNKKQKLYIVEKIREKVRDLRGLNIAILGLAFKSETDDIRESAAITVIEELLKEDTIITVYDPKAMDNARDRWDNRIFYAKDEYKAADNSDVFVILTEWNQFRNLDLLKIASLMRGNLFFDFRNVYKRHEVEGFGLLYEGIGQ